MHDDGNIIVERAMGNENHRTKLIISKIDEEEEKEEDVIDPKEVNTKVNSMVISPRNHTTQ